MSVGAWARGRVIVVVMCECVLSRWLRLGMRCEKTLEPEKRKKTNGGLCGLLSTPTPTLSPGGPNLFSRPHSVTGDRQQVGKSRKQVSPSSVQNIAVIFTSTYL